MSNRKNLEEKLRAIQELKSQKYIGTQEAWNYIDRIAALYENPVKIASSINEELEKKGRVYYRATPEIILGLGHFFGVVDYNWSNMNPADSDSEESYNLENYYIEENNISKCPFYDFASFGNLVCGPKRVEYDSIDKRDPEKITNYLMPIFKNIKHEISNKDFGKYVVKYSLDRLSVTNSKKEFFMRNAENANWDYIFSLENLGNVEKKIKSLIFWHEINPHKRVDRMYKDQVDHRLENRREILCDYINYFLDSYGDLSYDFLRENLLSKFQASENRLDDLNRDNAPEIIVNNEEKFLNTYKFLLTAIAPEKNFVNKYLRS